MKKTIPFVAFAVLALAATLALPVPQSAAAGDDGPAVGGVSEEEAPFLGPAAKCICICPEPGGSGGGIGFFPAPASGDCSDLNGTPCTIFGQPSQLTDCSSPQY